MTKRKRKIDARDNSEEHTLLMVPFTGNWTLMRINRIPGFHHQIGAVSFGERPPEGEKDERRKWDMCINMHGQLSLHTDLPHPDDAKVKQIWTLNPWPAAEALANKLISDFPEPVEVTRKIVEPKSNRKVDL